MNSDQIAGALDSFSRLLRANGTEPVRETMLKLMLRRYLESGLTKRAFLEKLIEDVETTRDLVTVADGAIDFHRVFVLGRRDLEDCLDLRPDARPAGSETIPLPTPDLIELVTGSREIGNFIQTGFQSTADIFEMLDKNQLAMAGFGRVLDFGCGVGRVLRMLVWAFRNVEWHGSDANPRLIDYCRTAFAKAPTAKVPSFTVNGVATPLAFTDKAFDFIYALSVFTHFDLGHAKFWVDELARVLKPKGYLMFSTMGLAYFDRMTTKERLELLDQGISVRRGDLVGQNGCAAFSTESFVRNFFAVNFEMVDFVPGGARGNGHQDMFLVRRR